MKRVYNFVMLFVLMAPLLWSESDHDSLAPLAPIEREFPMRVSRSNRNLYMDGPEALNQEKLRNREIINSRQFPWFSLIALMAFSGIGWVAFLSYDEWVKYFREEEKPLDLIKQSYVKLQQLQHPSFLQAKDFKDYYADLSTILKDVLQQQMQCLVTPMTTEEISKILEGSTLFSDHQKRDIVKFFAQSDAVIYANQMPMQQEALQSFESVASLVNSLIPLETTPQDKV
jgi:hypothetical protein